LAEHRDQFIHVDVRQSDVTRNDVGRPVSYKREGSVPALMGLDPDNSTGALSAMPAAQRALDWLRRLLHAANAVVKAVIELAHKLNIVVVAEGVETEAQLDILRSANCDEIRGYLLGRPEPYQVLSGRFPDKGVA
jgi:hypothetical protein